MYAIRDHLTAEDGTLHIGGVDTARLAEQHGTPLYVYDADAIRDRYDRLHDAFASRYDDVQVNYAVKANSNPHILDVLHEAGAGFDASSPAEITAAELVGADPEDILYTGAFPSKHEMNAGTDRAILNLDGVAALDLLDDVPDWLSFRVNPGVSGGRTEGVKTAGEQAKFGVPTDRIVDAYARAQDRGVIRFGIHMMAGSGVLNPAHFGRITERLMEICGRISDELGIAFDFIDLGGGFGVPYRGDEDPLDVDAAAAYAVEAFQDGVDAHGLGAPTLMIEPGRYLVAEAGVLLASVTQTKPAGKAFVGVDAGMHTLLRPALYDAFHRPVLASDMEREADGEKTIVGPVCENTDQLVQDVDFPSVDRGDVVAFLNAGAYGYGMASNYNTRPFPAEVLVDGEKERLIRARQEEDELFDRVPGY